MRYSIKISRVIKGKTVEQLFFSDWLRPEEDEAWKDL